MEEEFYSIIKLISGEEILSLISIDQNDGNPVVILQNPITMKFINSPHGVHIKVKPWMEISSDDFFIINHNKIITMTETKDERLIQIYNNYIEDSESMEILSSSEKRSGKVKPSKKMGYLSTVEDARKRLEHIFNLKDIKES